MKMNEVRLLTKGPVNNDIAFGHPSDVCIKTSAVTPKQAGAGGGQRGMFTGPVLTLIQ